MSFSVDKDVQRLLRAITGQGEPLPSALGGVACEASCRPGKSEEGGTDELSKRLWNALIPVCQVPCRCVIAVLTTPCELKSYSFHWTDEETGAQGGEASPRSHSSYWQSLNPNPTLLIPKSLFFPSPLHRLPLPNLGRICMPFGISFAFSFLNVFIEFSSFFF